MSETRDAGNRAATGNTPAPDQEDLRALLVDAARERKSAETEAPAQGAAPAAAGARGGAERGPDGRFRAGEQHPEQPPEPGPETPPAPAGEPPAEDGETPAEPPPSPPAPAAGDSEPGPAAPGPGAKTGPAGAPEHWSAGDKAQFGALSTDQDREIFLGMYKRMEAGYTRRAQRAADLERDYGELDQAIFTPAQRQILGGEGRNPAAVVRGWHQVETGLRDKQRQADVAARIIHAYGVDPGQIARHLNQLRGYPADPAGGQPPANGGGGDGQPIGNGQDPASGMHPALAARLDALEADKTARGQADQRAQYDAANREIAEFANAKDAEGNLAHPFFAELESEMMQLAYADRLTRRQPVVKDLYERALWANPATRDKQLALQRQAEERQAVAERRAKAETARHAGSSITGAPRSGQLPNSAAAPDKSIRESILAARGPGTGRI